MATDLIKLDYARTVPGHILDARYFYFEQKPLGPVPLAVVFGGHEKCASDFNIHRDSYPWYVLEYPVRGFCQLTVNSRPYLLKPAMIAGLSPTDRHHYKCDFQRPMEHIFIVFTGTEAKSLFDKSLLSELVCFPIKAAEKKWDLIKGVLEKGCEGGLLSQQLCTSYLRTLLLELAAEAEQAGHYLSATEKTYRLCRAYIDENYSRMMLPSEAAEACQINVRYMSRLFKQYHDCTPQEYIMRLKLNQAAILLVSGRQSVQDVAFRVGFEDPYHFSKNFKKRYGTSPLHYRKVQT